jgi:hypothetical protein
VLGKNVAVVFGLFWYIQGFIVKDNSSMQLEGTFFVFFEKRNKLGPCKC